MRRFMAVGFAMVVALAMGSASLYGASVNVDFNGAAGSGTYSGLGAAPDLGTVWNGISLGGGDITSGPLVDSTGAATAVTVSIESYRAYAANENDADFARALLTDFIYQPGPPVVGPGGPPGLFAINNLTPGAAYDVYLYSQNGGYSNTASSFTIGALTLVANNDIPPAVPGAGHAAFIPLTNYVLFPGVIANGGVIVGEFNDVEPANNAAFNGLQIVPSVIPEPASVVSALLGCGALLAGGLLRRRRAQGARRRSA
jgi:hypothetical protein